MGIEDDIRKAWKMALEPKLPEPEMKFVSWAEYQVLQEMLEENKLTPGCYPKPEFAKEYVERIKNKWDK